MEILTKHFDQNIYANIYPNNRIFLQKYFKLRLCPLINWFNKLDIDRCNRQQIGWKFKFFSNFVRISIVPKNRPANDLSRIFMKIVKSNRSNCTANSRSKRFTHIADKVGNGEKFGRFFGRFLCGRHVEKPIVGYI